MTAVYHKHGARFQYPRSWSLSEEQAEQEVCITVSSPETAFWSLTLFFDGPSPEDVAETVVQAFQDEYEELDIYPEVASVGPHQAVALNLEFMTLDLMNSAFVRVCRTDQFTAVILYQGTDRELAESLDVLEAISTSLELESSEEWPDFENRELDDEEAEYRDSIDDDEDALEESSAADEEDADGFLQGVLGDDAAEPSGRAVSDSAIDPRDDADDEDCDENERWVPLR